jgi:hypothetical protein
VESKLKEEGEEVSGHWEIESRSGFFFELRSTIHNLRSLIFIIRVFSRPFAVKKILMSRRCGAASSYRGIEELGGTPVPLF